MSPELRELFEIRQDEEKSSRPVRQNVLIHVFIRLGMIILGTIGFGIAASKANGWGALGYAFYMMIFHALWILFLIIETIVLQSSEKYRLRNVNFILIGVLLLIYGIGFSLI